MSGNWLCTIDEIDRCPCCENPTVGEFVGIVYINGKKYIELKFTHKYNSENERERLEIECEAFSESGGYFVRIPIEKDIEMLKQEWY